MNRNIFQKNNDSTLSESQESDFNFEFSNMQSSNTIKGTPHQNKKGNGYFDSIVDDNSNSDIESHKLFSDYIKSSNITDKDQEDFKKQFNRPTENINTNNMISEIKIGWIESNKSIKESHFKKGKRTVDSKIHQKSNQK